MLASKQPSPAAITTPASTKGSEQHGVQSKPGAVSMVRTQRLVSDKKRSKCQPHQIVVFPSDHCSTLPSPPEKDWTPKTFAGVHWTAGDVDPRLDAFPLKEVHGGYAGWSDIIYDAKDGMHPTLYKHHLGVSRAPLSGTKHTGPHPQLQQQHYSGAHPSELVHYGNAVLAAAKKETQPARRLRLLKEATDAFAAATQEEKQVHATLQSKATVATVEQKKKKPFKPLDLMSAVQRIVHAEGELRATADGLESQEDGRMSRLRAQMTTVKRSLNSLLRSSSSSSSASSPAPSPPALSSSPVRLQGLAKNNADPYMNRNAPWGYQDPFADYNPPMDNSAQQQVDYFYNIPS